MLARQYWNDHIVLQEKLPTQTYTYIKISNRLVCKASPGFQFAFHTHDGNLLFVSTDEVFTKRFIKSLLIGNDAWWLERRIFKGLKICRNRVESHEHNVRKLI